VIAISIILLARQGFETRTDLASYLRAAAYWIACLGEPSLLGDPDSGRMNAYVLWSLGFEWGFYLLVLPVCALVRDQIGGRHPTWFLPAAMFVLTLAMRPFKHAFPLIQYLPLFAIGMIAFEVQRHAGIRQRLRDWKVSVAALVALALGMTTSAWPYGPAPLVLYGTFFVAVAAGNDLWGLLRCRGALVLGECSYGIYLVHGTVLAVLFVDLHNVERTLSIEALPMLLPLVMTLAVFVSAISHVLIERPFIDIGRRLIKSRPQVTSSAPVADADIAP
jgi:peptidoglycan/LPS O-acetylase OafA/YrhL